MSEIAEVAAVNFLVAGFVNADAGGKGNLIGTGVAGLGFDLNARTTSRFGVYVDVWLPASFLPAEFPVELALYTAEKHLAALSVPSKEPLRAAQVVQIDRAVVQGMPVAQREHIGGRAQIVFDFGNGIPVQPGANLYWRLEIDGDDDRARFYPFTVAAPVQGPIFG